MAGSWTDVIPWASGLMGAAGGGVAGGNGLSNTVGVSQGQMDAAYRQMLTTQQWITSNVTTIGGVGAGATTVAERPKKKVRTTAATKPVAVAADASVTEAELAEYLEVALAVGVNPPDLAVERFKMFLRSIDMPVYSLADVVDYMDDKAEKENPTGWGWQWVPLRSKDASANLRFGFSLSWGGGNEKVPSTDYYGGTGTVYAHTVPLHALKKIAKIEKEFSKNGEIAFFISDYQTEPARKPDPFLMAVVKAGATGREQYRFVIDIWAEPSYFGDIHRMLKTDLTA